jgi:hypothetical protein
MYLVIFPAMKLRLRCELRVSPSFEAQSYEGAINKAWISISQKLKNYFILYRESGCLRTNRNGNAVP